MEQEKKRQKLNPFHLFDERMVVVSYRSWVVIGTLLTLTFFFLIWSLLGTISIKASGLALSLTTEGVIHVPSRVKGRVEQLDIKPGSQVKKGEPLALIYNLELEVDLKNGIKRMNELLGDYEIAKKIAGSEETERNVSLKRQIGSSRFSITQRENQLPFLMKDLNSKKTLFKEGLISASQLAEAERLLMEERINIDQLKAKVIQLNAELQKSYKSDEVKKYQQQYLEALRRVSELETRSSYLKVLSPSDGTILEVQALVGDEVKEGQSIALIEKPKQAHEDHLFYGYIPSEQGNKIKKGMQAQLRVAVVDPQKFGYLLGEVVEVSSFPVTDLHIFSVVQSKDLVSFLTNKNDAVTEVIVKPIKDSKTPSGFRWSSGKGPDLSLRSGLVAEMRVTVEKRRPISYLFPEWWVVGT